MSGSRMRIGYVERDAIVEDLRQAAEEGRITLEELDQRIELALAAKTLDELDPLVADLPVQSASQRFDPRQSPAALAVRPDRPGLSAADPLRLDGGVSTVERSGTWEIPPYLQVSSGAGTVKLDCLDAHPLASEVHIQMVPGAGTVTIVVPVGWAVDVDRLSTSWGTAKTAVGNAPAPGMPLLTFEGGVGMGTLRIRHPKPRDERRRARRARTEHRQLPR